MSDKEIEIKSKCGDEVCISPDGFISLYNFYSCSEVKVKRFKKQDLLKLAKTIENIANDMED